LTTLAIKTSHKCDALISSGQNPEKKFLLEDKVRPNPTVKKKKWAVPQERRRRRREAQKVFQNKKNMLIFFKFFNVVCKVTRLLRP